MSEEELVTIELKDLTAEELEMVNVVIHEGELRERQRIIDWFKSEIIRMEKESPNGEFYHNHAGMLMAIQLLEGTYENDWNWEPDE